jgi:glycosyltransferase involved in cell wall biosynthesis
VIHHGLSPERYPLGAGGGAALFLGRLSQEKGPHLAVEAASRANCPIVVAGRPHENDRAYFESRVLPALSSPGVTHIGEVGRSRKATCLAQARALLFPIAWEEPFGLAMIEAMLSGTPVLAFARGAVPEVVDPGVTGFLCKDVDEIAWRLKRIDSFDRRRCRERAIERFSARRMVDEYIGVYRRCAALEARDGRESTAPHA